MTIDRPEQWAIDKYDVERGLWALDTARGRWVKTYDHQGDVATRPEDFVFCGFREAARIYAGGLAFVDRSGDKLAGRRVENTVGQAERRVS